jgi:predicted nucleic acid-binding protein
MRKNWVMNPRRMLTSPPILERSLTAANRVTCPHRRAFTEELCRDVAGRIEGEHSARGVSVAFEDLLIGATALHLDFAVATLNVRHFRLIPGLPVIQL